MMYVAIYNRGLETWRLEDLSDPFPAEPGDLKEDAQARVEEIINRHGLDNVRLFEEVPLNAATVINQPRLTAKEEGNK